MLLAWHACRRRSHSSRELFRAAGTRLQMHSMSFQEAIATLNNHISKPRVLPSPDNKFAARVARFKILFKYIEALELEEPLSRLSVIHVAGTKGKGSTCAFTENILRSCGYRTGLFTSPHLVDIRERFRFNGDLVSEEVFAKHFWWCWDRLQAVTSESLPMPLFFPFLTLLALKMFVVENVDVAILEAGLGGRYDATNIVQSPTVCGITSLGFDHMEVLGNTLAEIASQKAGIFKAGVPAFSVPQKPEAMEVLHGEARSLLVPFGITPALESYLVDSLQLGLDGEHQRVNAALAVALCAAWEKKHQSNPRLALLEEGHLPDTYLHGLASTSWPGRSQVVHDVAPYHNIFNAEALHCEPNSGTLTFYLDGAHTIESLEVCANWFSSAVIGGNARDKELRNTRHCEDFSSNGNGCGTGDGHLARSNVRAVLDRQRVLLFNCMPKRDPQLLLRQLLKTCEQNGLHINMAIFVPPFSSTYSIDTRSVSDIYTSAIEREPDLSWQKVLQKTWESLQENCCEDSGVQPSAELLRLRQYMEEGKHGHLYHKCVLGPSSAVMPSLPAALNWLRCWALGSPVELQVLVTGSLYLVGDLLKICKQSQGHDT